MTSALSACRCPVEGRRAPRVIWGINRELTYLADWVKYPDQLTEFENLLNIGP